MQGLRGMLVTLLVVLGSGCGGVETSQPQPEAIDSEGQELQYCTSQSGCYAGTTCAGNACRPTCNFDNPPVEVLSRNSGALAFTGCPSAQYCCMGYYPTETQPYCAPSPSACLWGVYRSP